MRVLRAACFGGLLIAASPVAYATSVTDVVDISALEGSEPQALAAGPAGVLYGTFYYGGATENGAIVSFNPATKALRTVVNFSGLNGSGPLGTIVVNGSKLYGVTSSGGHNGLGTIFSVDLSSDALTTIYTAVSGQPGHFIGGVVADAAGNLYGGLFNPGQERCGAVFKFSTATRQFGILATVERKVGCFVPANLTFGKDGALYGTASFGGALGGGTVFRVATSGGPIEVLHDFPAPGLATAPNIPVAGLTVDALGDLYGVLSEGGPADAGAIFRLNPSTKAYALLHVFAPDEAYAAYTAPTFDSAGRLLGSSQAGGTDSDGNLFRLNVHTGTFDNIYSFPGAPGIAALSPVTSLVPGPNGSFYGLAFNGGLQSAIYQLK